MKYPKVSEALKGNKNAYGCFHYNQRKLNEKEIKEIRRRYKDKRKKISQFKLAMEYGLAQKSIWDILTRNTYKDIK